MCNASGHSAAWLAHLLWEQRVAGSNPAAPTNSILLESLYFSSKVRFMSQFPFQKDKYLSLFQTDGAPVALTQLQTDIARWEHEAFEGPQGYQPDLWQSLDEPRALARKIWNLALENAPSAQPFIPQKK